MLSRVQGSLDGPDEGFAAHHPELVALLGLEWATQGRQNTTRVLVVRTTAAQRALPLASRPRDK